MKLRRYFLIVLALIMCAALTGCSSDEKVPAANGGDASAAQATAESAAEPIEVAAHIQSAFDMADLLDGNRTVIIPGEGILTTNGVDPVHHHTGYSFHTGIAFPTRLTLDQTRQQFPI